MDIKTCGKSIVKSGYNEFYKAFLEENATKKLQKFIDEKRCEKEDS